MATTTNMALTKWPNLTDLFSHTALAANFDAIDAHDHTAGKGVQVPTGGLLNLAVTTAKLADGAVTTVKIGANQVTSAKVDTSIALASQVIRIVRGTVNSNGSTARGTGFTSSRASLGVYNVAITSAFSAVPVVVAGFETPGTSPFHGYIKVTNLATTGFTVTTEGRVNGLADFNFGFVAVAS